MPDPIELTIILNPTAQTDTEELDILTRQLRQDILDLQVADVYPLAADEGPEQAKSGFPVELGALLVTVMASRGVLPSLIDLLKTLLTRHSLRSVTLEIDGDKLEVGGILAQEQQRLIDAWMSRHPQILIPGR